MLTATKEVLAHETVLPSPVPITAAENTPPHTKISLLREQECNIRRSTLKPELRDHPWC